MIITGLIFTGIAAALHVYIFILESVLWTTPRARKTFGTSVTDAQITKPLALNQGFYNLFLAVATGLGIVFYASGETTVGATLIFTGAGSMVAAALVLLISDPGKARAAITQGITPLIGVAALAIGLAL